MNENTIYSIIKRFFDYKLPKHTQDKFRRWLISSKDNSEKENAMLEVWNHLEATPNQETITELNKLHQRIYSIKRKEIRDKIYRSCLRIAAILILPLVTSFITYTIVSNKQLPSEVEWVHSFSATEFNNSILLSDGTEVFLNTGTLLVYPKEFKGKERSLFLTGQAVFNVAKDPDKPFIVKTQHMDIEAIGTSFDVEAYANSNITQTTLIEGKVKIEINDKEYPPTLLTVNEQITYHHITGSLSKKIVDTSKVTGWRDGHLIFENDDFNTIIQSIEHKYNVSIQYESSRFNKKKYNIKFYADEDLLQILDVMQVVMNFEYRIKGNTIYLY